MLIHRTSSWCSFLDAWNWRQFFGGRAAPVSLRHTHPCFICQLLQIHRLLRSSLAPENVGFEPFGGCARLFCTIPSFGIDHSRITELYISTHKLPPKLIIYQLAYIDWNIIILPALGTAIPLRMDQFAGHSPSALVENSNKSFFSPCFSTSAVHFVNPESSSSSLIERKRRMHTSVVPHHSKNKPF